MARILFEQPFSKRKAELIESLIRFTLDHLAPEQTHRTRVNVIAERGLLKKEGFCADVTPDNLKGHGEYTIRVDPSADMRLTLLSIAHETVHVKQFVLEEPERNQDPAESYWDDPMEIEAYGRELGLFVRWAAKNGHTKKSWAQGLFNP
jgi:hypothetical protein